MAPRAQIYALQKKQMQWGTDKQDPSPRRGKAPGRTSGDTSTRGSPEPPPRPQCSPAQLGLRPSGGAPSPGCSRSRAQAAAVLPAGLLSAHQGAALRRTQLGRGEKQEEKREKNRGNERAQKTAWEKARQSPALRCAGSIGSRDGAGGTTLIGLAPCQHLPSSSLLILSQNRSSRGPAPICKSPKMAQVLVQGMGWGSRLGPGHPFNPLRPRTA